MRVWRPLHLGPYDSQGVALYSGSSRATRSGLCCNVGDLCHTGMCDGTMSSSDDVPVPERAYRFALTVTVEDEHEAYDDPEWIADPAWGREPPYADPYRSGAHHGVRRNSVFILANYRQGKSAGPLVSTTRKDSVAETPNASSRTACDRSNSAITDVGPLPTRTHMAFGGAPKRNDRSPKSESFETITYSASRANDQIARSSASASPQASTCAESGNTSATSATRRRDKFWSNSSLT